MSRSLEDIAPSGSRVCYLSGYSTEAEHATAVDAPPTENGSRGTVWVAKPWPEDAERWNDSDFDLARALARAFVDDLGHDWESGRRVGMSYKQDGLTPSIEIYRDDGTGSSTLYTLVAGGKGHVNQGDGYQLSWENTNTRMADPTESSRRAPLPLSGSQTVDAVGA